MHHIFAIDEIVRMIADNLSQEELDCLAQAHPAFNDLAMDRRWHDLKGLDAVIDVLPKKETSIISRQGQARIVSSTAYARDTALDILKRVRRMEYVYSDASSESYNYKLLRSWAIGLPNRCLLPALCSLTIALADPPEDHGLSRLLGPGLKSVSVTAPCLGTRESSPFFITLEVLKRRCKHLESLSLSLTNNSRHASDIEHYDFEEALKRFRCLEHFKLDGLFLGESLFPWKSAFIRLAGMDHLKTLQLCNLPDHPSSVWRTRTPRDVFPSLTALTTACSNLSSIIALLETTASTCLQCLYITATGSFNQPISALCRLIATRWPDLTSFRIRLSPHDGTDGVMHLKHLAPLFSCHNMRNLRVSGTAKIVLSEDDVRNAAKAWPRLQTLYLVDRVSDQPVRMPMRAASLTPAILYDVATYCPDLRYLGLSVDFDAPYSSIPRGRPSLSSSRLHMLHLGMSTLTDRNNEIRACLHLHMLFPNICELIWSRTPTYLRSTESEVSTETQWHWQRMRAMGNLRQSTAMHGRYRNEMRRRAGLLGDESYDDPWIKEYD